MGIAVSMILITVGAIMRFAVSAEASGFNVGTAGAILMIVGVIGALLSIGFWASWGGVGNFGGRTTVVHTTAPAAPLATVVTRTDAVVEEHRTI